MVYSSLLRGGRLRLGSAGSPLALHMGECLVFRRSKCSTAVTSY